MLKLKTISAVISIFFLLLWNTATGQESKVKLISRVTSNSLFENECFTLSSRLLVRHDNDLELRFTRLGSQINSIRSILTELDLIYRDWEITDIKSKTEYYDGHAYAAYELIRIGLCPYNSGELIIPSLSISLDKVDSANNFEKILTFSSDPVVIQVEPIPPSKIDSIYSNEFYKMVGDFEIEEKLSITDKVHTGDKVNYQITISGNGIGEMIDCNVNNVSDISVVSINSTIDWNQAYRSTGMTKKFHIELVFNSPGTFDLGQLFKWRYYSTKDHSIKTITAQKKISVHSKFHTESPPSVPRYDLSNLIIALDVSESMYIEDYVPNRLTAVTNSLENFIDKYHYRIPVVLFAGETKLIDSKRLWEISNFRLTQGTAIGNALWESTKYLKESEAIKKTILLIGDGDNTAGFMNVNTAIELLNDNRIKVISIGIGKQGKVPFGKDDSGRVRYIEDTYNDKALSKISESTGSQFNQYKTEQAFVKQLEEIFKVHSVYDR